MFDKDLFVKYHWRQILSLGMLAIMVVGWQVILEDTNIFNKKSPGVVKGEAIMAEQKKLVQTILDYQASTKNIIIGYLKRRANFNRPHQDWLFLINKTKYKILALSAPLEYKELETQLTALLEIEYEVISGKSQVNLEEINQKWQMILEQYFWLDQ